ncbi:MAG: AAA family ATPase [Bacteroidales bacterium]|nr:AAA family ATPase [Bacteroidales bacterium]
MEKPKKLKVLKSIGRVYEAAKGSKLEAGLFENIDTELKELAAYFNTTEKQAFFLSIVFTMNYKGDTVDIKDLVDLFDCNPISVLEHSDDIDLLFKRNFFIKMKSNHPVKIARSNDQLIIHKSLSEAILKDQPLPYLEKEKPATLVDVLEKIYNIGEQRYNEEISTVELFEELNNVIEANLDFPLIKRLKNMGLDLGDTFLLMYVIWKTIIGNECTDLGVAVKGIYDISSVRLYYTQSIMAGNNPLIKMNFLEIEEARFFDDTRIKLCDTTLDILKEEGIKLFASKKKKNNIIEPQNINSKVLYFNKEEQQQMEMLKQILNDTRLKEIQLKMHSKSLPTGITALLHGFPGTGKTESVLQIAKEANRDIVKVDISQTKSMWFGESEKIIKRIFTDYNEYAKECKTIPILFFNEADAIISKRKDITDSNVAQVENTIQNIILEELENFKGIFIATTNMLDNIDAAFERRFLFKLQFKKPSIAVKAKIWHSKLPFLSEKECYELAKRFDFSGGQIDNIVRKIDMQEIIKGVPIGFIEIIGFCENENFSLKHRTKIGF